MKEEGCYRCLEPGHWARDCPEMGTTCTWCGIVGHIEKTCYSKANGVVRTGTEQVSKQVSEQVAKLVAEQVTKQMAELMLQEKKEKNQGRELFGHTEYL